MAYLSDEMRDKLLASGFPPEKLPTGCAEDILSELPEYIEEEFWTFMSHSRIKNGKKVKGFEIQYYNMPETCQFADTLANAASQMYIHLAENDLIPTPLKNEQPCGCHDHPTYGHVVSADCPLHD